MKTKNISIILSILILTVFGYWQLNSQKINQPLVDKVKTDSTSSRFVLDLSGKWEKSYDDVDWTPVEIPYAEHSLNKIIFKKNFRIDKKMLNSHSWHLVFNGVDDNIEVYINNDFIGKYLSGMNPFTVRIPQKAFTNEANTIKIVVTSATDASRKVKEKNIFARKVFTGIIREIFLMGTPQVWVSNIKYNTQVKEGNQANVNVKAEISSGELEKFVVSSDFRDSTKPLGISKTTVQVESALRRKNSNEVVASSNSQSVEFENERTIPVNFNLSVNNANLWSPDSPNLYEIVVSIYKNGRLIDRDSSTLGFVNNTIKKDANGLSFFVNNQPIELKGVDYIEESAINGPIMNYQKLEEDVLKLKTLGANFIRVKYYAPNPYLATLCDKYGLFMLLDIPIYDSPKSFISTNEIKVRMMNTAERLVDSYDTHPSVFGWGLSENIQEDEGALGEFFNSLSSFLKKSSNKLVYKTVKFGAKSINVNNVDFVGFKDYRGYHSFESIRNEVIRMKSLVQNKPIFLNYGAIIQPDNHNGFSDPLSLDYQANYILNLYKIAKENFFAGSIISSFNDYELNNPLMFTSNINQHLASSGLVDRNRQQRISYIAVQALFNNEKEPLLNAGSFSNNTPVSFIVFGLFLIVVLVLLINRFRRFREYIFRSLLRPYNFYADIRDQRILSLSHTIFIGIIISFTIGIFYSSVIHFFKTSEIAQMLFMMALPNATFQEFFYNLVWMPEVLMLIITITVLIFILLLSLLIKIIAYFLRARFYFIDSLTIIIWSAVPILALLPIALTLSRLLMLTSSLIWIVIIIYLAISIWVLLRIMKASSVVFDVKPLNAYLVGFGIVALFSVAILAVYQSSYSMTAYIQHLIGNFI